MSIVITGIQNNLVYFTSNVQLTPPLTYNTRISTHNYSDTVPNSTSPFPILTWQRLIYGHTVPVYIQIFDSNGNASQEFGPHIFSGYPPITGTYNLFGSDTGEYDFDLGNINQGEIQTSGYSVQIYKTGYPLLTLTGRLDIFNLYTAFFPTDPGAVNSNYIGGTLTILPGNPPGTLSISNITNTSAQFNWSGVGTSWNNFQVTDNYGNTYDISSSTTDSGSYTFTGLNYNNTPYTLTITRDGRRYPSLTFNTRYFFEFSRATSNSVVFSWYNAYFDADIEFTLQPFKVVTISGSAGTPTSGSYTISDLEPSTLYRVQRLPAGYGLSSFFNSRTFLTLSSDGSILITRSNNKLISSPQIVPPIEQSPMYLKGGYYYGQTGSLTSNTISLTTNPSLTGRPPQADVYVSPFIDLDGSQGVKYSFGTEHNYFLPKGIYTYQSLLTFIASNVLATSNVNISGTVLSNGHADLNITSGASSGFYEGLNGLDRVLGLDGRYTVNAVQRNPRLFIGNVLAPHSVSFLLSDSSYIYYITDNGYIYQINISGGSLINTFTFGVSLTGACIYNGYIYITSIDSSVVTAISTTDGSTGSNIDFGTNVQSPVIGPVPRRSGNIGLGAYDITDGYYIVYDFTVMDLTLITNWNPSSALLSTINIGNLYYSNDSSGIVYVYDAVADTTTILGSFSQYTPFVGPLFVYQGKVIYPIHNGYTKLYDKIFLFLSFFNSRGTLVQSTTTLVCTTDGTNIYMANGGSNVYIYTPGYAQTVTPYPMQPLYSPTSSDTFLLNGSQGVEFYFHNLGFPLKANYKYTYMVPPGRYTLQTLLDTLKRGIETTPLTYTRPRAKRNKHRPHGGGRHSRRQNGGYQTPTLNNPYEPISYTIHVGITKDNKSTWSVESHGSQSLYDPSRSFIRGIGGLDVVLGLNGDIQPSAYTTQSIVLKNKGSRGAWSGSTKRGFGITQGPDGTIYTVGFHGHPYGTYSSYIYANGTQIFEIYHGAISSICYSNGYIYFVQNDTDLYGLNLSTNQVDVDIYIGDVQAFDVVIDSYGVLYVTSYGSTVYKVINGIPIFFTTLPGTPRSTTLFNDTFYALLIDVGAYPVIYSQSINDYSQTPIYFQFSLPTRPPTNGFPHSLSHDSQGLVYAYQVGAQYYMVRVPSGEIISRNGALGIHGGTGAQLCPSIDGSVLVYTSQGFVIKYQSLNTIPTISPNAMVNKLEPTVISTLPTRAYIHTYISNFSWPSTFLQQFKSINVWKRMIHIESFVLTDPGSPTPSIVTIRIRSPTLENYYDPTGIIALVPYTGPNMNVQYEVKQDSVGYPIPGNIQWPDTFHILLEYIGTDGHVYPLPDTFCEFSLIIYEYSRA